MARQQENTAPTEQGGEDAAGELLRTCWRGLCFCHPADWEEAALSDCQESGQVVLVDRRFQRMQVQWQQLQRPPDLGAMYSKLRDSLPDHPISKLTSHPNWTGLVRKDAAGHVVHAGRFFQGRWGTFTAGIGSPRETASDLGTLVQAVITWPGARDEALEAAILDSIAPQASGPMVAWEALGLHVHIPRELELTESSSKVGHVIWTFRGRKKMGQAHFPASGVLTIERLALPKYWLKTKLEEWLKTRQPGGFRIASCENLPLPGHSAVKVHARHGGLVADLARRTEHRLAWSWLCEQQQRIHSVTVGYRGNRQPALPEVLVHCCQDVKIGAS